MTNFETFQSRYTGQQIDEILSLARTLTAETTKVTNLTNIPNTARLVVATIGSDQTLRYGKLLSNQELHIVVIATANIVVTLPSSAGYRTLTGTTLEIESGRIGEINIISDGTTDYIRAIS